MMGRQNEIFNSKYFWNQIRYKASFVEPDLYSIFASLEKRPANGLCVISLQMQAYFLSWVIRVDTGKKV
jgi:hypothetical protein